jgi:hypothetical protein
MTEKNTPAYLANVSYVEKKFLKIVFVLDKPFQPSPAPERSSTLG